MQKISIFYIKKAIPLFFILCILALFFKERLQIITGIFFGFCIRALLFRLQEIQISNIVNLTPENAKIRANINYITRYVIYGLVLFISTKNEALNIFGTFLGLCALSWSIHINNIIDYLRSKKN